MPLAVYVLGLGIFALTTSEYMVSGLMPALSAEFDVSFASVGFLVTVYAGAMAVGGPLLTVALLKMSRKTALLGLVAVFVVGQVLGAVAQGYGTMVVARLVTAVAAAAFFGVALTACAELVGGEKFARASSLVLGGLMFGTVLGLPAATLIGERFGWRVSFLVVAAVALAVGLLLVKALPAMPAPPPMPMAGQLAIFRSGKLWAIYATSLLLIGATFAGFTYFVPILTEVSGFSAGIVPVLLVVYGVATIVGNNVVGRLADRFTIQVLVVGLVVAVAAMVVFALFAQSAVVAVLALVVIGLTGVSMNPALVTRGARVGQNNMLVNSVHTACIMLGVMVGSWIGGLGIDWGMGLRGPLWIGAALGVLGLLTLVPDALALRRRPAQVAEPA